MRPSNGKTLAVTGASRGLGRHIASRAAAAGYNVIGLSRSIEPLDGVRMLACDVGDPESVAEAGRALRKEPDLYGFVNAAGIASMNLVFTTPPATMARIVRVNLLGTMLCCQMAGKLLARKGAGRIVNFSTIAVPLAIKGEAVYAGSKAGVETFSRAFAREMADHGVTVNCVAPGPIDTALIAKVPSESIGEIVSRQIIQRKGTPEDVWDIVSLLLEPAAGMITGEVLHVGGA
jgi:3-oxoacyl-[acyl-carrier protein] reductase